MYELINYNFMYKRTVAFVTFLFIGFSINAQIILTEQSDSTQKKDTVQIVKQEESTEVEKMDVIYQHDGTTMNVDVKRIYLNDIYYSLPGETKVNKMDQRLVHKIEYRSGKIEILNETAPDVREVGDYRKVKVTKELDDVEGLIEVAKLEAVAEGSDRGYSTTKSLERTATIVLRKKAALVNADIVLITDKRTNVAFGEIPSVTLYGTAYSYR